MRDKGAMGATFSPKEKGKRGKDRGGKKEKRQIHTMPSTVADLMGMRQIHMEALPSKGRFQASGRDEMCRHRGGAASVPADDPGP